MALIDLRAPYDNNPSGAGHAQSASLLCRHRPKRRAQRQARTSRAPRSTRALITLQSAQVSQLAFKKGDQLLEVRARALCGTSFRAALASHAVVAGALWQAALEELRQQPLRLR